MFFGTEWPFIFWDGSGPLQLGVVLVTLKIMYSQVSPLDPVARIRTHMHISVYFSQIVLLNFGTLRRRHFFVWPQFLALEDDKASYDAYEMRNGCKIEWSGCRPKPLHRRAT